MAMMPECFSKAFSCFHRVTLKQAKRKGTELHLFNPLVIKLTKEGGMNTKLRAEAARGLLLWQEHFQMKSSMMTTNIASRIFRLSVTKNLYSALDYFVLKVKRDLYGLCNPVTKFNYDIGVIIDEETDVSRMDEALAADFQFGK